MKLLLMRHAQSTGNRDQRMQGHGSYELTTEGKARTQKLAHYLSVESWVPSHLYSSPLVRASQTTEVLLKEFPADSFPQVIYSEALREFQVGVFEGLTWTEAQARYPDLCAALEASPDWLPIPGAETLQEAHDRAQGFIQSLLTHHTGEDQIWIVTHSWILQHLVSCLMGCDRTWGLKIPNLALFEFQLDQSRWSLTNQNRYNSDLWQIHRFNEYPLT